MSAPPYDADVLVVGAGPAGVSAAMMATSLHLRTMVVEAGPVGGKLHAIGALENVLGNWSTGPQLAEALASDLTRLRTTDRCTVVQARATEVSGRDDRAELALEDGQTLTAQVIVVATGVATLTPSDVAWVSITSEFPIRPIWRALPADLKGRTYVLGGDRPLGTWLRTHPKAPITLHVLCPPADDYRVKETAADERIHVMPISRVTLSPLAYGPDWNVEVEDRHGDRKTHVATTVLNNLGNRPAALRGLVSDTDGYCPPNRQHPRIRVVGDLRSARYQRIATAQGAGAEAVLAYYYATALNHF